VTEVKGLEAYWRDSALLAGWWMGAWSGVSLHVVVARWLKRRAHHPLQVYAGIVLLFIPVVLIADPIQIRRGWFEFSGGYTIWTDVLLEQAVMWPPVLLYVWLQRRNRLKVPERDRIATS